MRSLHTPMTWEEFERMPWRMGWKHEYWDGCAHITPRDNHVHVCMKVEPRAELEITPAGTLRSVKAADAEELIECFIKTFEDGVEFCDWRTEQLTEHALRNITDYFAGRRGSPLEVSRLATANRAETAATHTSPVSAQRVVAAALFTQKPDAPVLDLLMVRPGFRRRGIARAPVTNAMNELDARGVESLRSAYVVSNEESAAWHLSFGFIESLRRSTRPTARARGRAAT
ncbi:MAG: GNAT family N-acetyltransferase [Pyrinomonadaceae bacterium]